MALPLLESMVPARDAARRRRRRAPKTRLGCIYVPHGATMDKWTPRGGGHGLRAVGNPAAARAVPRSHEHHQRSAAIRQAYGAAARPASNHNRSAATFLSGAHAEAGPRAHLGYHDRSVRGAAHRTGHAAAVARAVIEDVDAQLRRRFSCAYRDTISWQSPDAPLPMQNNPQVVFERLFGDGSTDAERRARRQQSLSLLDSVLGEVASLQQGSAGRRPRPPVDQYLDDVREIERRIQTARKRQSSEDLALPDAPVGAPNDVRGAHQADVRSPGARLAGRISRA